MYRSSDASDHVCFLKDFFKMFNRVKQMAGFKKVCDGFEFEILWTSQSHISISFFLNLSLKWLVI